MEYMIGILLVIIRRGSKNDNFNELRIMDHDSFSRLCEAVIANQFQHH